MKAFSLGCNFDKDLIFNVISLNTITPDAKITEFYGSHREYHFLTARPAHRLPNISNKNFEEYIDVCKKSSIAFNYTLNSLYLGSKRELHNRKNEIIDFLKYLQSVGVDCITISNPILAEIIRDAGIDIELAISTVAHIDTVTQIKLWHDNYKISKIHNNILKNRSIRFLKNAFRYCSENNIELCLLVNEFCGNGLSNYSTLNSTTHCIYRDCCYLFHSENETLEEDYLFNEFPFRKCIDSRKNLNTWLKTQFIRPEDLIKYDNIGIKSFKITGRTGSTEYLTKIAKAYIEGFWDGNLLSLWKPLETTKTQEKELAFKHHLMIENKRLNGFIDFWFENEDHDCSEEICGETCNYCDLFASERLK